MHARPHDYFDHTGLRDLTFTERTPVFNYQNKREKMALPPPFKKIFSFSLRLSFKIKDFYLKSLDFTLLQNELV
jgi:hypothetical protein